MTEPINSQVETTPSFLSEKVGSYLNALAIDETHVATAVGVDVSGVYSSETIIRFKDTRHKVPPKVLAFRLTLLEDGTPQTADVLPAYTVTYNPFLTIFGGGFTIDKWTVAIINRNNVVIRTYANSPFSEQYLLYVLQDKQSELR